MKKILILLCFVIPGLSFASFYSCQGDDFSVEVAENPVEMKIKGNGINVVAQDVFVNSTFNTVVTGNLVNPGMTAKLSIKDSHSGDRFKAGLQLSSAAGVKNYSGLVCLKGNE